MLKKILLVYFLALGHAFASEISFYHYLQLNLKGNFSKVVDSSLNKFKENAKQRGEILSEQENANGRAIIRNALDVDQGNILYPDFEKALEALPKFKEQEGPYFKQKFQDLTKEYLKICKIKERSKTALIMQRARKRFSEAQENQDQKNPAPQETIKPQLTPTKASLQTEEKKSSGKGDRISSTLPQKDAQASFIPDNTNNSPGNPCVTPTAQKTDQQTIQHLEAQKRFLTKRATDLAAEKMAQEAAHQAELLLLQDKYDTEKKQHASAIKSLQTQVKSLTQEKARLTTQNHTSTTTLKDKEDAFTKKEKEWKLEQTDLQLRLNQFKDSSPAREEEIANLYSTISSLTSQNKELSKANVDLTKDVKSLRQTHTSLEENFEKRFVEIEGLKTQLEVENHHLAEEARTLKEKLNKTNEKKTPLKKAPSKKMAPSPLEKEALERISPPKNGNQNSQDTGEENPEKRNPKNNYDEEIRQLKERQTYLENWVATRYSQMPYSPYPPYSSHIFNSEQGFMNPPPLSQGKRKTPHLPSSRKEERPSLEAEIYETEKGEYVIKFTQPWIAPDGTHVYSTPLYHCSASPSDLEERHE